MKVDRELIRWQRDGDKETIKLEIGVELEYKTTDTGVTTNLRKGVAEVISGLLRDLTNAQKRAKGETTVQVSLEEVPGRPYKKYDTLYGDEVPGVPWKPMTKQDVARATSPEPDGVD